MAAAEGGSTTGATISTNGDASPYGGGGVGGKFRKRPFRGRQTTPYDRPSTAARPIHTNRNNSSWLTKLVVDPATKLISYGADRFLPSIFKRKQLPPPPTAEVEDAVSDGVQGAISNNQHEEQEIPVSQENLPINESTGNPFSELEQLLKQRTFSRSEILHLTQLLRSRANEPSRTGGDGKKEASGLHPKLESDPLEEDRTNVVRSADMSTAIVNSKALEDSFTSPADLAKSYMGSRPPKVSHSWRAMPIKTGGEDMGLLGKTPLASKSPFLPLTNKTYTGQGSPENCFTTPRSLGRSAIYNMARTPYSRVRSTSNHTGSSAVSFVNAASLPSSSASFDSDDRLKNPTSLKRRNTSLDDEVGSIGPLRRIRQKPNLLVPRIYNAPNGVVTSSDVEKKRQLIGDSRNDIADAAKRYDNGSIPSTSYSQISTKSSEVAGRIFQHLEKLSPSEKSSQSNLVARREKQHLELKPSMLSGRALKSMENIESPKIVPDFKAGNELPERPNTASHDTSGPYEKQSHGIKSISNGCTNDADKFNKVPNSAAMPSKVLGPSLDDDSVRAPPRLPKKRAFRMSAEEDLLEEDDDLPFNGLAPQPLSEGGLKLEPLSDSKHLLTGQTEVVKPTVQSEVKPSSVERSEAPRVDGCKNVSQASEVGNGAVKPFIIPASVSAFGKTDEANIHPPIFSFSPTVAEKLSSFSSESNRQKEEPRPENPSSVFNASASQPVYSESDKMDHANSSKAGMNRESENTPSVKSKEPLFLAPVFGTAASSVPTGTSSAVSSGVEIFGISANPVFKFGMPVDQSIAAVSTSLPANISEDSKKNVDGESSLASISTAPASAEKITGSSTFGLLMTNSAASNPQSSTLFSNATKPSVSGVETISQGVPGQSITFASLPSFGMNNSASSVPSLDSELPKSSKAVGSTTITVTSADASKPMAENGPGSSLFKFGVSSSATSDANAVSSSSSSAPSPFSFGLNSSSSTNPVGTSSGASPFTFGFGSSVSSSLVNTSSSFASGSMFGLGVTSNEAGSSWESSKPLLFGSSSAAPPPSTGFSAGASSTPSLTTTFASSPSTGFSFGASTPSPTTTFASSQSTGYAFNAPPVTSTNAFASSPSTGFSFGASSTPSASTNTAPTAFNPSTMASSSPIFPFTTTPSASPSFTQPVVFGGTSVAAFGASPPMNAEDSMAEDPSQSATPPVPVFGQPSATLGFSFGSAGQPQASNPFMFGGAQQSPSPFQASGSLEFQGGGGSFSLGSGGGDKSGRKIVKVNRNRSRKR